MTCGLTHASYSLPQWQAAKLTLFAPCPIKRLFAPSAPLPSTKFCISVVFSFFGEDCNTQANLKTNAMQSFGGKQGVIMIGDVQMAIGISLKFMYKQEINQES